MKIIYQLNNKQKNFIWNRLNLQIKNSTINNNYKKWWLKKINIAAKISNFQFSQIKRLFNGNFLDWKILPLHVIHKSFGKNIVFLFNLQVNKNLTNICLKYYSEIINTWSIKFSCQTLVASAILSWQLFKTEGAVKPWEQLPEEYGLLTFNKWNLY